MEISAEVKFHVELWHKSSLANSLQSVRVARAADKARQRTEEIQEDNLIETARIK